MAERVASFRSLDVLRGLAALWVVMDHSCDRYVSNTHFEHWPIYAFSLRGQFGVVLFFLISGYCIIAAAYGAIASGKKVHRFAYDRLRRIYPPYFFSIVVSTAVAWLLTLAQRHHLLPPQNHTQVAHGGLLFWISNFFLLQIETHQPFINVVFWSLCYEVFFYVIVGAFLFVAQWTQRRWGSQTALIVFSVAIGVLTLESVLWGILAGSPGVFPLDRWYQFGLGGLFFLAIEINSESLVGFSGRLLTVNRIQLTLAVILTLLYGTVRSFGGQDIGHPSSRAQIVAAMFFLIVLWILRRIEKNFVQHPGLLPLFWLGTFSYSLYLIHPVILPFIDVVARRVGLTGNLYLVAWVLQIGASVIAGWIYFLLIERHFISSRQKQRLTKELIVNTVSEPATVG